LQLTHRVVTKERMLSYFQHAATSTIVLAKNHTRYQTKPATQTILIDIICQATDNGLSNIA